MVFFSRPDSGVTPLPLFQAGGIEEFIFNVNPDDGYPSVSTDQQQKQRNAAAEALYEIMQRRMIEGQSYRQAQDNLKKLVEALKTHDSVLQVNHDKTDTETQMTLSRADLPFVLFSLVSPNAQECFFSLTPPTNDNDLISQTTLLKDIIQTVCTLFEPENSHGP